MHDKPLLIDLYCGLGGWAEGFLAEGYRCIGFDVERHDYGSGEYPGQLVIQDVTTLHGSQFKNAAVIVASPPCTEYSYMAMPWARSKQIAMAFRDKMPFPLGYQGSCDIEELNRLFDACFRIQREACEAAGRYIPLIVENVRGAQPWVGQAKANFGSYYLWGDVGMVGKRVVAGVPRFGGSVQPIGRILKGPGGDWFQDGRQGQDACLEALAQKRNPDGPDQDSGSKTQGHLNIHDGHSHTRHLTNQAEHTKVAGISFNGEKGSTSPGFNVTAAQRYREENSGLKQSGISGERKNGKGDRWFQDGAAKYGSQSNSRKAASAQIAKIPFALANHIAKVFLPT